MIMKLSPKNFGALAFVASASAQYFSAGWTPGQTVSSNSAPAPTFVPEQKASTGSSSAGGIFDLTRILTSGPVVSLFERAGVNITERLGNVLAKNNIWDQRIPLITDDNYGSLIVNETLTEVEEKDRVWFIVISVTAAKQDGISKLLDDVFDTAYNETHNAGEVPHVRWGRIDYLNVTAITTKWGIWQAPYLVVLKDRGQTLRFYKPHQLKLREEAMREFLKQDGWKVTKPWSTEYAPGGSREYLMEYLAIVLTKVYNVTVMVPKWLLFLISGGLASVLINFLHKGSTPAPAERSKPIAISPAQPASSPVPSPSQGTKRGGARQRKAGK